VINLSKSSAVELAPDYIRVNAICPGFIATPLNDGGNPEAIQLAFSKSQPWPDYGRGEHIAGASLFLASDDAAFVTGESIVVDGGATAEGPGVFSCVQAEIAQMAQQESGRSIVNAASICGDAAG
jgi:NAD(P)-dependent dehydrogenase (short-subunit alcohol dehydrogenase family)